MQTQDFTRQAPPGTQTPVRKRLRRATLEKTEARADERLEGRGEVERKRLISEVVGGTGRYGAGF